MGGRDKHPKFQQDPRWPTAHLKLQQLWQRYKERHPEAKQGDFGKRYGIGSQSMVSQYMNAIRPLSIEAASKFAKGFGCEIKDISPEMDRWARGHIFPAFGIAGLVKAVGLGFLAAGLLQAVPHSEAATSQSLYIMLNRWLRVVRSFLTDDTAVIA